jgi:hypothetical protein
MRRQQLRRNSGFWDDQEQSHHRSRVQVHDDESNVAVKYEDGRSPDTEDEDPFVVFGRMVKGATKQLWKKVSAPGANQIGDTGEESKTQASTASDQRGPDSETNVTQEGMTGHEAQEDVNAQSNSKDNSAAPSIGETETTVDGLPKYLWLSTQMAEDTQFIDLTNTAANPVDSASQKSKPESVVGPPRSDSRRAFAQHSSPSPSQALLDNTSPPYPPTIS